MAYKNKLIRNPLIKQDVKFIQTGKETNGEMLEIEATYHALSKEPIAHYHPNHVEDFIVLSGRINVRIDGHLRVLKKGDTLHIPVNKAHSMWNNSFEKAVLNWKVKPAVHFDHFLETLTGLANDGKTNEAGIPDLLQSALIANKYADVFRISRPSFAVQKIIFLFLTPVAYLLGYRPTYGKYLD